MIRIVVGGDVCPMGNIQKAFEEGASHEIFHDLIDEISSADLSIVNLECPLISHDTPITKVGDVLCANIRCIQGFVAAKWKLLNLANNHSFDHGGRGLLETIDAVKGAGLSTVGAGVNIRDAQEPFIAEIKGRRVVVYAMAEREFSIADEESPGANPLDLINFVKAVQVYKQDGIFIVLIHGGKEYYPYPSPEMVRRCRFMVDMGADAVICCHAHCPLPWETYARRPIVYGLGNLVFEATGKEPDGWNEGYLARLFIGADNVGLEIIPYFQSKGCIGARRMDSTARNRFLAEMRDRNEQVRDKAILEDLWGEYCRQQKERYLTGLFGYNRLMRKARRVLLRTLHSKHQIMLSLLLAQCETHREILNTIFRDQRR